MQYQPQPNRSNLMENDVVGHYLTSASTDPSAAQDELREIHERLGRLIAPDVWSQWQTHFASGYAQAPSADEGHFRSSGLFHGAAESPDWLPGIDPDFTYLVQFTSAVSTATMFLSTAFQRAEVEDFRPPRPAFQRLRSGRNRWHDLFLKRSFYAFKVLRTALAHEWTPTPDAEPYEQNAFLVLCSLTPARRQLMQLRATDRRHASLELVRQLDLIATQVALASDLQADLLTGKKHESPSDLDGLRRSQQELLQRAGRSLTLPQAAEKLNVSRQALHKRIRNGTALGVMFDDKIIVPSIQFVETDGHPRIVDHLKWVLGAFEERGSGHWAALQFLIDKDPNLEAAPIDSLKEGNHEGVAHAARSYLGIDEG